MASVAAVAKARARKDAIVTAKERIVPVLPSDLVGFPVPALSARATHLWMLPGNERFPQAGKIKIKLFGGTRQRVVRQSSGPSVEPLVLRVERGDRHIDEFHLSDRAVAATGLDQHRRTGPYRMADSIQFHRSFPSEEIIDFRHPLVVVTFRFSLGSHQMERGDSISIVGERPSGLSARTGNLRNFIELTDAIKRFRQISTSVSERVGCFRLPFLPACSVLALLFEFKPLFFKFDNFFLDLRKLSMCFLSNQGVAGFE